MPLLKQTKVRTYCTQKTIVFLSLKWDTYATGTLLYLPIRLFYFCAMVKTFFVVSVKPNHIVSKNFFHSKPYAHLLFFNVSSVLLLFTRLYHFSHLKCSGLPVAQIPVLVFNITGSRQLYRRLWCPYDFYS